jgi:kynureninase
MSTSAPVSSKEDFRAKVIYAKRLDAEDPLRIFKNKFHFPRHPGGRALYFCGNSLGLQPKSAKQALDQELEDWASLGVKAHFEAKSPWFPYNKTLRESTGRIVGARPEEIVYMNSMTVNLHLLLASFYRPATDRRLILVEERAFPSVTNALLSHLRIKGLNPEEILLRIAPRAGEETLRHEDIDAVLKDRGRSIALVLLGGVHYNTGQALDIRRITAAAREQGCVVGWDLAHAVGNLSLSLHLWDVDFAVWCSYKYLNAGPGACGGCYIHERHGQNPDIPRLAGGWGNDPEKRFAPSLSVPHSPVEGAEGWQISNPSILAMAPLRASLEIFDEAGIENLRLKSEKLTGYLMFLLKSVPGNRWNILTPQEPEQRGCQVSMRLETDPAKVFRGLEEHGVICDFRTPDVLRVAPVPLYNSFEDAWRFVDILSGLTA